MIRYYEMKLGPARPVEREGRGGKIVWTDEMIEILKVGRGILPATELAMRLGVSAPTVRRKLMEIGGCEHE